MSVERELKLGVPEGFVLPDPGGAVPGATLGPTVEQHLVATYHDTPDLALARRGITLRHRTGEGGPQGVWTLKLPKAATGPGLTRREVTDGEAGPGDVPAWLARAVAGWTREEALRPVGVMTTVRRSTAVLDAGGAALASVDDDAVTVDRDGARTAAFRELEIELAPGADEAVLAALDALLRGAGAREVGQEPKIVQALGEAARLPPDDLGADAERAALACAAAALA